MLKTNYPHFLAGFPKKGLIDDKNIVVSIVAGETCSSYMLLLANYEQPYLMLSAMCNHLQVLCYQSS